MKKSIAKRGFAANATIAKQYHMHCLILLVLIYFLLFLLLLIRRETDLWMDVIGDIRKEIAGRKGKETKGRKGRKGKGKEGKKRKREGKEGKEKRREGREKRAREVQEGEGEGDRKSYPVHFFLFLSFLLEKKTKSTKKNKPSLNHILD